MTAQSFIIQSIITDQCLWPAHDEHHQTVENGFWFGVKYGEIDQEMRVV